MRYAAQSRKATGGCSDESGKRPWQRKDRRAGRTHRAAQHAGAVHALCFTASWTACFIGQIPGEGALALAGAGVCGPVVTMVGSVAFLCGRWRRAAAQHQARRGRRRCCAGHSGQLLFDARACSRWRCIGADPAPSVSPCCGCSAQATPPIPYAEEYFTLYLLRYALSRCWPPGLNQFIVCQGFASRRHEIRGAGRGAEHRAGPGVHLRPRTWACAARPSPRCFPRRRKLRLCGALPAGQASPPSASPLGLDIPRPS